MHLRYPRLARSAYSFHGSFPSFWTSKTGIREQTFHRWKAKYTGLEVDQVRQIAQLSEESLRLKRLVADLTLDKTMLQDVL